MHGKLVEARGAGESNYCDGFTKHQRIMSTATKERKDGGKCHRRDSLCDEKIYNSWKKKLEIMLRYLSLWLKFTLKGRSLVSLEVKQDFSVILSNYAIILTLL